MNSPGTWPLLELGEQNKQFRTGWKSTGRVGRGTVAEGASTASVGLRSAVRTESCDPSGWPAPDGVSPPAQSQVPARGPLPRPEDSRLPCSHKPVGARGAGEEPPMGSALACLGTHRGLGRGSCPPPRRQQGGALSAELKAPINQLKSLCPPPSVLSSVCKTLPLDPQRPTSLGSRVGPPAWWALGEPRAPS